MALISRTWQQRAVGQSYLKSRGEKCRLQPVACHFNALGWHLAAWPCTPHGMKHTISILHVSHARLESCWLGPYNLCNRLSCTFKCSFEVPLCSWAWAKSTNATFVWINQKLVPGTKKVSTLWNSSALADRRKYSCWTCRTGGAQFSWWLVQALGYSWFRLSLSHVNKAWFLKLLLKVTMLWRNMQKSRVC